MQDIDFQHIRPSHDGARHAFEELVCQIARRNPPEGAQEFRRIEGAGGDGGVEAYWRRRDGKKTGYQAKYHLKSAVVDWAEIDGSVETALDKHPKLDHYVVAIPCDLTDRTGKSAKGKTGWGHWETHKAKWREWVAANGRSVTFEPWTKHNLCDFLNDPANAGLAQYWFDLPRFDAAWFERHLQSAIADLDERYHPEDHVEIHLEAAFDGLKRHPRVREGLTKAVSILRRAFEEFEQSLSRCPPPPPEEPRRRLREVMRDIDGMPSAALSHLSAAWPIDQWRAQAEAAAQSLEKLETWTWSIRNYPENEKDNVVFVRFKLHGFEENLTQLKTLVFSR